MLKANEEDENNLASSPESNSNGFADELEVLPTNNQRQVLSSNSESESHIVQLEPFLHQVGGHFPMACLDQEIVCKLLNEHEDKFYRTMSSDLLPFTPRYEGTMQIDVQEDDQGFIMLSGNPPEKFTKLPGGQQTVQLHHNGNSNSHEVTGKVVSVSKTESKARSDGNGGVFCNPWALKCHRDNLKKMGLLSPKHSAKTNANGGEPQLYLLLENVVSKFKLPCILDLKVGRKQYSEGMTEAKKASKKAKVANTTSASLGLRLAGMQVFDQASGDYICRNKYYGRSLKNDSFISAISEFFSSSLPFSTADHVRLRVELVQLVIRRLEGLIRVVSGLDSYRFHTSSLLVAFDGQFASVDVEVRIIDFAHSTHPGLPGLDKGPQCGPDEDFINGLESFVEILHKVANSYGKT